MPSGTSFIDASGHRAPCLWQPESTIAVFDSRYHEDLEADPLAPIIWDAHNRLYNAFCITNLIAWGCSMSRTDTPVLISLAAAQAARNEPGRISALMLRRGTLELRYYVPPMPDPQLPHTRDELYVVAQGKGNFVRAGERVACGPGDVLFVPANVEHRFVDCSPGFAVWVMFYGPKGGERD